MPSTKQDASSAEVEEAVLSVVAHDLNQAFDNIQDIDFLSDFQVTGDETNSAVGNVIIVDQGQDGDELNEGVLIGSSGQEEVHMILEDDGQASFVDHASNELVIGALTGEDIVFENVASEVSIPASTERVNLRQNILPSKASPKKIKATNIAPSVRQVLLRPQGQPIMVPVGNHTSQAAGLAQFITSIRPPAMPGSSNQSNLKPKTIPIKTTTTPPVTPIRKQATIAPAPSANQVTKVIMTQTGQQLLISSPLKSEAGTSINASPQRIMTSTGTTITSSGQQIMFLSPVKGGMGGTQKLIQVRPKPSIAPTPIRIATTTVAAPAPAPTPSSQATSSKSVQVIRLVSLSSTAGTAATSSGTVSYSGLNKNRPIAPNTSRLPTSIASAISSGQKMMIPASSFKSGTVIQASSFGTGSTQNAYITTGAGGAQVIMLPAQLLQGQGGQGGQTISIANMQGGKQSQTFKAVSFASHQAISGPASVSATTRTSYVPIAPSPMTVQQMTPAKDVLAGLSSVTKSAQNGKQAIEDANRQRKPCNCTKSQCLKLYCDCFANGEFCHGCNCTNCSNNLDHEEERQKAIKQCLERNPHAFHPKIGKGRVQGDVTERRHTKGCNCRRSGCLKNYCECYEAKILCSDLCKCCSCKNYEDSFERKTLMHLADAAEVRSAQQTAATKAKWWGSDFVPKLPILPGGERLPCSFITNEVLEATCQCLLATAEHGEKRKWNYEQIEKSVLEEFGRCLVQIIDSSNSVKIARLD